MASSAEHSKLLTLAARKHLAPLGCKQQGRSRFWFDDHGWWAATVEFQPSSWSKGSYLNVGAMWFWHPADHWVFNEFERVAPFQEFRDDIQFAEVARTREKLGLPALSTDADLWVPAGRVTA